MITDRIQSLADQKKIPIAKMLKDLNMGQGTFSSWKKRGTSPKGEMLQRIADYFGVTVDYLLSDDSPPIHHEENYSENQQKLLKLIQQMDDEQCFKTLDYLEYLISKNKDKDN